MSQVPESPTSDPASSSPLAIAELRNITKSFTLAGGRELKVLDQIDLAVHEGELFALLGQSGSGKSTILRCLTGLAEPTTGRVLCYGEPLQGINPYASIVFQTFALYPWPTVEQNVAVGLMSKRMNRAEKCAAVEKAIDLIGLGNYHAAYPREISGGMRQRVGIARALVSEPKILCLDEAFSALDVLTAENLRNEVITLWHAKDTSLKSIFMVTHNIEEAVEMATRICILFPRPWPPRLGLGESFALSARSAEPGVSKARFDDSRDHHDARAAGSSARAAARLRPADSRARSRMESIPTVPVGQILGLLSILQDAPDLSNIYDISNEIGKEFGETISTVKAAEILELVDTPKNDVKLTDLGVRFLAADREGRKQIFSEQVHKLRLFHIILEYLKIQEEVEADQLLKDISAALPYDNPEKVLQTMIAWGRYAGIMDYNAATKVVFVPKEEEEEEA